MLRIRDRLLRLAWVRLFSSRGYLYFEFGCFIFDTTKGLGEGVALVLMRTAAKNGMKGMFPGSAPLSLPQITDRLTWVAEFFSRPFPLTRLTAKLGQQRLFIIFTGP